MDKTFTQQCRKGIFSIQPPKIHYWKYQNIEEICCFNVVQQGGSHSGLNNDCLLDMTQDRINKL
ncbi:hypothetical protein OUZ56_018855 [Daphnia magna]|uniref:Uncharacterized protein n=1 Tax=Daphnia magna TaxID=35525 RepID=A0ABQ9Z9Y1_9CRUS|nr:hypothetical protein OUZ56_018855 [Daphnia magna]